MQIFINNEEVLCSSSMIIQKQLSNTSSVILNNVYPRSWEDDKDYVSRFYMPKDYSKCKIIDENLNVEKVENYDFYSINNLYVDDTELKIKRIVGARLYYIAVIPGEKYLLTINSNVNEYVYEGESFYENQIVTRLAEIQTGTHTIEVIPTKNYIIFTKIEENLINLINSFSIKIKTTKTAYDLINNATIKDNRVLNYSDSKIYYNTAWKIRYIKVIPNKTYIFKLKNPTSTKYVCESNSLNIGTQATRIQYMGVIGEGFFSVTPTCKYLLWDSSMEMLSCKLYCDSDLVFSGIVKNSGKIELNPRYPHYATLQILDFETFLSDGDTLNYVLEQQTITNAIKRIVEDLDGFMVGDINITNEGTIAPYNCNEKTAFDVFEYLAEISGSIWFTKVISDDIVLINFCSIDNLEQARNIEYTQQYFEDNSIQDISYSFNTQDYRNKQVIVSDKSKSGIPQTEYLTYNGTNLRTLYNINSIVSIKSGTRVFTTAPVTAQQNGTYADFYYSGNDIDVNVTIATGTVLEVTYYTTIATRQVAYNQNEIDRISSSTGRNGTIARYEKRTDTNDSTALSQIAQSYLDFKGAPEVILTIKTYNHKLLELGQKVFFDGPLDLLKTTYLVKEKKINMIISGDQEIIFYTYVLTSSFNDENAINFFDNQRRKLEGNIEEGQYITKYIDLYSTTNIIFYNLNITEVEQPVNMLDAELDFDI